MSELGYPTGLRYSERKLWDECPEAHQALDRLARVRRNRRHQFCVSVLASIPGTALAVFFGYALGAGWIG